MTLLIKNVKVLGAERTYEDNVDVFVNDDKISAIGNFPRKNADQTLDGMGAYLSPGFIDVNTDSDHYLSLFTYPQQDDFLRQGVTTIIGGMCGSSLAPLIYGGLESIRKWADIRRFNVNWSSVAELLSLISKRGIGVNFGTLVGHSTIRRAIVGNKLRDLTRNELDVFKSTLSNALDDGAFGFSTGLSYVHAYKTPYAEIKALVGIVKERGGVYATHLRSQDEDLVPAMDETLKLAQETNVRTLVSHFMPIKGFEETHQEALQKISALPKNIDARFDIYPFDTRVLSLYTFLPLWAQNGEREVMVENLEDEWFRSKIEKELPAYDADAISVAQAPGNESLVGKTLRNLALMYGLRSHKAALLKLMQTTNLNCVMFYRNIALNLVEQELLHPRALIASNSASFETSLNMLKPERATATFTKFLEYAELQKKMPLPDAVKKITSVPAKFFGIRDRGVIREGAFADLTLFKDAGIKATIVNGVLAYHNDVVSEKLGGRALRSR